VGWDVEKGVRFDDERWRLSSLEVASGKFPAASGNPEEHLRKLNDLTKAAGWHGAGLWCRLRRCPHSGRSSNISEYADNSDKTLPLRDAGALTGSLDACTQTSSILRFKPNGSKSGFSFHSGWQ
jgi:hypothetical protein